MSTDPLSARTATWIVIGLLSVFLAIGVGQVYHTESQYNSNKDSIATNTLVIANHELRLKKLEEEVTARQREILAAISELKIDLSRERRR